LSRLMGKSKVEKSEDSVVVEVKTGLATEDVKNETNAENVSEVPVVAAGDSHGKEESTTDEKPDKPQLTEQLATVSTESKTDITKKEVKPEVKISKKGVKRNVKRKAVKGATKEKSVAETSLRKKTDETKDV